jgi:hypothetical protein
MAPSMCKTRMCELRRASASVGDFPCVQLRDTLTGRLPRARLPGHSVTPGGARSPPGASDSEPESPSPARYCPSRRLGGSVREWQLDRSSLTGLQVGVHIGTVCVVTVWVLCGYCVGTVWCGGPEQASGEPGSKVRPGARRPEYPAAIMMARFSPQPPCCGDCGGVRITAIP